MNESVNSGTQIDANDFVVSRALWIPIRSRGKPPPYAPVLVSRFEGTERVVFTHTVWWDGEKWTHANFSDNRSVRQDYTHWCLITDLAYLVSRC